jgi:hypothetical protein
MVTDWGSVESFASSSLHNFENLLKAIHYRVIYRNRRLKEDINMMINVIILVASFIRLRRTLWLICLQNVAKLDLLRKCLMKWLRGMEYIGMLSWVRIKRL